MSQVTLQSQRELKTSGNWRRCFTGPEGPTGFLVDEGLLYIHGLEGSETSLPLADFEAFLAFLTDLLERSGTTLEEELSLLGSESRERKEKARSALALAGALTRKVGRWEDVLDHLRRADLGGLAASLPNYPYPDLLRALAASVEALEPGSRERYLELAVFPEDAAIP